MVLSRASRSQELAMRPFPRLHPLRIALPLRALVRRWIVIAVVVVLGVLLGLAGGPGATAGAPATAPQPRPPLLARGVADDSTGGPCLPSLVRPFPLPGYYETAWPSEHRDPWRTHAAAGGLPADVGGVSLATASVALPVAPAWGYTRARDQIFVIGGSPFFLDVFTELIQGASPMVLPALTLESLQRAEQVTPYVARIDPSTMTATRLDLSDGTTVNYTGGLLVHQNGFLYAVAQGRLYKIDADAFTIVQSMALPLVPGPDGQPNRLTAFNGMQATANGDLILKGWPTLGGGAGILLRVNPDTLDVIARLVSDDISSARLTIADSGGREFLYHLTDTTSLRFELTPTAFTLDPNWSAPYRTAGSGSSGASSDVYVGQGVVFADNTSPTATTPMRVFSQAAGGGLSSTQAFVSDAAGWNFFMMLGDPFRTGIVVVEDQLNGQVAAYRVCAGGSTVQRLWETDAYRVAAGAAIAWDRGHLYIDDRRCSSAKACELFLVVLDLESGREMGRARVAGIEPSIGQIFIGMQDDVYFPTTDATKANGYLNRIFVAPTGRS
jgi:hypothetical protein